MQGLKQRPLGIMGCYEIVILNHLKGESSPRKKRNL